MGMGIGDVEIVDVSGGVTFVEHRPRRNVSIRSLANTCIWATPVKVIGPPY